MKGTKKTRSVKKFFIEIVHLKTGKTHISEFNQSKTFRTINDCQAFLDGNFIINTKKCVVNHWEITQNTGGKRESFFGTDGRQVVELQKGIDIYLPHENDDQNSISVSNWVVRIGSGSTVSNKLKNKYIVLKNNKALVDWTDEMVHDLRPEAVLRLYALRGQYPVLENTEDNNDIHGLDNPQSVWNSEKEIAEHMFFTESKKGVEIFETKFNNNSSFIVKFLLLLEKKKTKITVVGVKNKNLVKNITIPAAINGKPVKSIVRNVFENCTNFTKIVIPDSVTEIKKWTFKDCESLEEVRLPESLKEIGRYAFENCFRLKKINIPESIVKIDNQTFMMCKSLKEVQLPKSLKEIGNWAFENCTGLTNINIPNSVTSIGDGAFYKCTGLTNIVIPNSVTSIGDGAFGGCTELKKVVVNATNAPFLEEHAFDNHVQDRYILVPKEALEDYKEKWSDYENSVFPVE